jgi:hypothetical protein
MQSIFQTANHTLAENKEPCDLAFTPSEKKLILEALIQFIDAGNVCNENDLRTLFVKHLDMLSIPINENQSPLITWVCTSFLGPNLQINLASAEYAALLYNPTYEGEIFFTVGTTKERQQIETRIIYFLFSLETTDKKIKHAIQKSKQLLANHRESNPNDTDIKALTTLCDKIKKTTYSEGLKSFLIACFNSIKTEPLFIPSVEQTYDLIIETEKNPIAQAEALLRLCKSTQKKSILTKSLMDTLLKIYYEIYCIFKTPSEPIEHYQEIMFAYFVLLKQLTAFENLHPEYNELIHLLICGAFQSSLNLKPIFNNTSKPEAPEVYFQQAMQWYFENEETIKNDWGNTLRFSILKFIIFSDKEETFSLNEILLALTAKGDQSANKWLGEGAYAILIPSEYRHICEAQKYYGIVKWLINIGLFSDMAMTQLENIETKIKTINQYLTQAMLEENRLLITPLINYVSNNNPRNPVLMNFFTQESFKKSIALAKQQANVFLLQKKCTKSTDTLTKSEFYFLIDVCNQDAKAYPKEVRSIILLDLYCQIYKYLKSSLTLDMDEQTFITITQKKILNLKESQDQTSLLYEISNILLFHFKILEQNNTLTEHAKLFFLNTVQACSLAQVSTFKSVWAHELRKEALIMYFSLDPHTDLRIFTGKNPINSLLTYLQLLATHTHENKNAIAFITVVNDILKWEKCVSLTESFVDLSESKNPITQKIAELEIKQKKTKDTPKKTKPINAKKVTLPNTRKLEENKNIPMREVELEAERKIKQQKIEARRIKAEEQRAALEAREALEKAAREKEQKTREETRIQRAKETEKEERRRKEALEQRMRLQAEKRAAKKATKELEDAAKLKALIQAQAEAEALKARQLQEALIKKESDDKQMALISTLREANNQIAEERKQVIDDRPLSFLKYLGNFSLNTMTPIEISQDNLQTLKTMDSLLGESGDLELFGSYTVFLASLRLGMPLEKTRSPSDIDLRIKLKGNDLLNYAIFIKQLASLNFTIKNYNQSYTIEKLKAYIVQKISKGFLNLSKPCLETDPQSKEMDLTIIFPTSYIANTNPFTLLRHFITLKDNEASFNAGNTSLTTQLGYDIIENSFQCNILEIMDLQYNVFNFFPRAIKNLRAWEKYFHTATKSMHDILNDLELITDFFSIRFNAKKHNDCYMEIAGLIAQNYFLYPESTLILEGFLNAFLKAMNVESNTAIHEDIIAPDKIASLSKQAALDLQTHVLRNSSFYNTKEKYDVCAIFYKDIIEYLYNLNIAPSKKIFLQEKIPTPEPNSCVSPEPVYYVPPVVYIFQNQALAYHHALMTQYSTTYPNPYNRYGNNNEN